MLYRFALLIYYATYRQELFVADGKNRIKNIAVNYIVFFKKYRILYKKTVRLRKNRQVSVGRHDFCCNTSAALT